MSRERKRKGNIGKRSSEISSMTRGDKTYESEERQNSTFDDKMSSIHPILTPTMITRDSVTLRMLPLSAVPQYAIAIAYIPP